MKINKKVIILVLSIFCCAFLASCVQGGSEKLIEMSIANYFDQQEVIVKIPKKTMMFGNEMAEGGFMSKDTFSIVKNDFIKNNSKFKFKEYSDHCLLMTTGESGEMRHYLLTLYSDINYGVFAPLIYTDHVIEDNNIGMAGERLYYPIHLLNYSSQRQQMDFLGKDVNLVKPNIYYQIKGSVQEFRQFYLDTGYFELEETDDGFILRMASGKEITNSKNLFKKTYQFHFVEKDDSVEVMYSYT